MTGFELVKVALDALYAEALQTYGPNTDATIAARIQYLSTSYSGLNNPKRPPVNYQDPATRFAYVFKYVASHSDYIVQVMEAWRSHVGGQIMAGADTMRITCVGGGPGSDLIGFLRYLDENKNEPIKKATAYLLDREQAWADTWTELDDSLKSGLVLHANFQPLDVTNPASWMYQKKFLQADLFTMSYFVSEVKSLDSTGIVSTFWTALFQQAKSGARFLYVDNGHDSFNQYFDALWQAAGLHLVLGETNEWKWPRGNEQKSELGGYLTKFGQSPKLKTMLTYRVLAKP
ncbi:hypothetical protein [uncultured Ramlibacter sp.]|uniref:hypothetical protein n=1 Tax=uncultured Ramlibacter sp. TaxID=260755 RepID=UPI00263872DC|nr:hypothetical protein [uncultured Ramlibacter sp.]